MTAHDQTPTGFTVVAAATTHQVSGKASSRELGRANGTPNGESLGCIAIQVLNGALFSIVVGYHCYALQEASAQHFKELFCKRKEEILCSDMKMEWKR